MLWPLHEVHKGLWLLYQLNRHMTEGWLITCVISCCAFHVFWIQQQEQDPTNLYLSNLPVSMDEQELENLLKPFGQVVSTRILRDTNGVSRGVGFARLVRLLILCVFTCEIGSDLLCSCMWTFCEMFCLYSALFQGWSPQRSAMPWSLTSTGSSLSPPLGCWVSIQHNILVVFYYNAYIVYM